MAFYKVTKKQEGGGSAIDLQFYRRIIEAAWDGTGSITYTFDEDIDDCVLVLTYTRETSLSDTRYTLTLASGTYSVMNDSGVVVGSTTQERVVYLKVDNIRVGDTLFVYNYGDLKTADILKYSASTSNCTKVTGTFVSSSTQYGIVNVNVGFKPDLLMVRFSLSTSTANDTVSFWEKGMSWAETHSIWELVPAESVVIYNELGRTTGEAGIQQINNNGFSFMSQAGNTLGRTCEYIAIRYDS